MKKPAKTPTTALYMPFWTSLDVSADSGKPTGLLACAYTLYTAQCMYHTMKLRYGIDNQDKVRSTAMYPPPWVRVTSVHKDANATLQ